MNKISCLERVKVNKMTISSALVESLASAVGAPEAGLRLILGQMAGEREEVPVVQKLWTG